MFYGPKITFQLFIISLHGISFIDWLVSLAKLEIAEFLSVEHIEKMVIYVNWIYIYLDKMLLFMNEIQIQKQ